MITIMIVDDKPENLYLLESMFADSYRTVIAANGAEALGLARRSKPDLIITDILMPVMDGFTLCKEWKKDDQLKHIPLVFYTATYTDEKDERFALGLGADLYIVKPQEPDVFMLQISGILSKIENEKWEANMPDEVTEVMNLREYNEVLVRKLEDKIVDAERSRLELMRYAEKLEREIAERKSAEKNLKLSEEQYRTLVNSMNEGMVLIDSSGTILYVNNQFCEMSGYSSNELVNHTSYLNLFKVENQQISMSKIDQRNQGVKEIYEMPMIRKDRTEIWVKISASPVYNDEGDITGSMGVFENIQDKKLIEAQLIHEKNLFQTLARVSPMGIFRTQVDGFTTYVNPKWSELSGLSFEESLGDGWLKAVHPEDRLTLQNQWEADIKENRVSSAEYRFLRRDGSIIWVAGSAVQESVDNEITGYVGTITDITERKKFEEELLAAKERAETSDRLKTAFMNNISHEVRTPLNGILGFGEMIAEPDVTGEEKSRYLEILNSSSDRLLKTINDFMDISLVVSRNMEVRRNSFNLNEFLVQLFNENVTRALAKKLEFNFHTPDNCLSLQIYSDTGLLKKVFSHLLDNAIKFSSAGSIIFGYNLEKERIQFFVTDEGVGIAQDKLALIFEHFMQEDYINTRKFEGSGLGLSIAKGIVELLGGTLWVKSVKGQGSSFFFTIPGIMGTNL